MADETIRVEALVIGAGPGGYVAGIRLGQLKKKALVVEKDKPGGICLNVGCIPSKALINASKIFDKIRHGADIGILADNPRVDMAKMQAWKGEVVSKLTGGVKTLLKANGCDYRTGVARFVSRNTVELVAPDGKGKTVITADHIIIATGSRPIEIPGFKFDGNRIVDSTGALDFAAVPEKFVVIGGGYIGIEIGTLYAKLGSKVTVVEALPGILAGNDPEIVQLVARKLKKLGVEVLTGAKAKSWAEKNGRAEVTIDVGGKDQTIEADKVLVAVGRRPNSEGLGLEEIGVKIERGFVPVDRQLRTNVPGIYAIGDVAGQPMLAHKASHEAEVVAEVIAGTQGGDGRSRHPRRHLQRSGGRHRRDQRRGSDQERPGHQGRQVPLRGARPGHRQRRHRRFREGGDRRRQQGGAGHSRRRQRRLRRHRRGGAGHRDGCAGG